MVITTTSIAFILLSLGLTFCGWRFWAAFRRAPQSDRKIGLLLSLFYLGFGLMNGVFGFGTILFANNPGALFFLLLMVNFLLIPITMIGVYTAHYIFSPHVFPYLALASVAVLGGVMIGLNRLPPISSVVLLAASTQ